MSKIERVTRARKAIAREALDRWPDSIRLGQVRADLGKPAAKADGRTTPEERDLLRSLGWEPFSAGWWVRG